VLAIVENEQQPLGLDGRAKSAKAVARMTTPSTSDTTAATISSRIGARSTSHTPSG